MSPLTLTLNASALTDSEYALYTEALLDLAGEGGEGAATTFHDDSYYASLSVSAREARALIRGLYTTLPLAQVDMVLRLFCPSLAAGDTLHGGQFFAALRLVTHLRHGKSVDSSLVFVPPSASGTPYSLHPINSNIFTRFSSEPGVAPDVAGESLVWLSMC
jgi:hypothetical protein